MSQKKRRRFSASFKSKVAVEALKERTTLSELAAKYELHPNQITNWKKQLLSGCNQVFESGGQGRKHKDADKIKDELYKTVGQLKVENDWLKKKSEQIFGKNWEEGLGR